MDTKGFAVVERAVKKSFDRVAKVAYPDSNMQRDADVKFYESLKPEAFDVIAATYGPDNLVAYIAAMESKRLKGMKNG